MSQVPVYLDNFAATWYNKATKDGTADLFASWAQFGGALFARFQPRTTENYWSSSLTNVSWDVIDPLRISSIMSSPCVTRLFERWLMKTSSLPFGMDYTQTCWHGWQCRKSGHPNVWTYETAAMERFSKLQTAKLILRLAAVHFPANSVDSAELFGFCEGFCGTMLESFAFSTCYVLC